MIAPRAAYETAPPISGAAGSGAAIDRNARA
jgi:hypothetical protein